MTGSSLEVGASASLEHRFTQDEVAAFAALTGDANPVHLDPAYAATTRFGRPIVHGMLTAGLIGTLLGTRLPGPGAVYLSQTLRFERPVYPDTLVTARVEVVRSRADKPILTLATTVSDEAGAVVLSGEAIVLVDRAAT